MHEFLRTHVGGLLVGPGRAWIQQTQTRESLLYLGVYLDRDGGNEVKLCFLPLLRDGRA